MDLLFFGSKLCQRRRSHLHPEHSRPQPAGTVRAEAEVQTRAGCEWGWPAPL